MKKTINYYDFNREFGLYDQTKNSFSNNGKKALFNYLEEYEESTGKEIELDVIALNCNYTEYSSIDELFVDYGYLLYEEEEESEEEKNKRFLEVIENNTVLIRVNEDDITNESYIIQPF